MQNVPISESAVCCLLFLSWVVSAPLTSKFDLDFILVVILLKQRAQERIRGYVLMFFLYISYILYKRIWL